MSGNYVTAEEELALKKEVSQISTEVSTIHQKVATIETLLVGVPATGARGLFGEMEELKSEIGRRFDSVARTLTEAGAHYVSKEGAATMFVAKSDCTNCAKGLLKVKDWRFWVIIAAIVLIILGVRFPLFSDIIKAFTSLGL